MAARDGYGTPADLNRAISARARSQATAEASDQGLTGREITEYVDRRINQLRQDVAFYVALRRISASGAQWVLKGGVGLQLRLDPSRPSRDIDLALVGENLEHAEAIAQLAQDLALDDGSFFGFEIVSPAMVGPDEQGSLSVPVKVLLGNHEYARFSFDLAPPKDEVQYEMLQLGGAPLGLSWPDDSVPIAVLTIESQIAEKICAIHEVHGSDQLPSSRWRDLADIAMIASQTDGIDGTAMTASVIAEVARRKKTLPNGLSTKLDIDPRQAEEWRKAWGTGGRQVALDYDDALAGAKPFIDPVMRGDVQGRTWNRDQSVWV